jgi:hypothetical protein
MRLSRPVFLALSIATLSCAEERLQRRAPRANLTVYATGQAYDTFDDATLTIDLGKVPVFATKWAIFLIDNPTQVPLQVEAVEYTASTGQRWGTPVWIELEDVRKPERPLTTSGPGAPFVVPPFGKTLLGLPYAPLEEGAHAATAALRSNAANAAVVTMTVNATAVFEGAPDVEVQYGPFVGPLSEHCTDTNADTVPDTCVIPGSQALDMGNIGLDSQGTAQLTIRNKAECPIYLGVDACTLCSLSILKRPDLQNIGFDFKPGTNDLGYFQFYGSTTTPFDIRQRNVTEECDETGEVRLLLTFNAPATEGDFQTVIVIESNDPDEPAIEIPVRAGARNAPVAIAEFRALDPDNPSAPYTDPGSIAPLDRVYFDGRKSYDPRACPACSLDPSSPDCAAEHASTSDCDIETYRWEVISFPAGLDPNDFQPQGADSAFFSFWLPLAGPYTVRLTVFNGDGIQSGDTVNARVEFTAIPGSRMHVQLTWDDSSNDQDLHLWYLPETEQLCNQPWDCFFSNKMPVWFASAAAGDGPNPRLDIDDTNGLGPENINIDDPQPSTYRIVVHYWADYADSSPTRNTVRVFLNGLQVAEYRRTLSDQTMWLVGDIAWNANGTGTVTPYPSDAAGQVGTVLPFPNEDCSAW